MGLNIIKKYLSEFHDGALLAIDHVGQDYVLSLESAEMDRLDMKDDLSLSERGTIKGNPMMMMPPFTLIWKKNSKNQ